jgi:hypothetical protein
VGEDTGLPRTGARHDQQGAAGVDHGGALLGVEAVKERVR